MGETRNREYFSRKCRRKSIELCHCQIQRRLQWRLWLYCCSTCQKVSSSETAKNGLLHETIVIAGVRSYIKSYQRWSISTFHIKENQWQFVSIFWTNIYAVKILLYMKNSSSPVIICSFQVSFSASTATQELPQLSRHQQSPIQTLCEFHLPPSLIFHAP